MLEAPTLTFDCLDHGTDVSQFARYASAAKTTRFEEADEYGLPVCSRLLGIVDDDPDLRVLNEAHQMRLASAKDGRSDISGIASGVRTQHFACVGRR